MKGLVLAAGRGSRLKDLTKKSHKCEMLVSGRMLVDLLVESMNGAGISDLAVCTGYLREKVASHFRTEFHNPLWNSSNMVLSLFLASDWFETEETIVSYADIIIPSSLLQSMGSTDGDICIPVDLGWESLWTSRFGDPLIDSETLIYDSDHNLTEIGNRPESLGEVQAQFMGLVKITPEGWAQLKAMLGALPLADILPLDMTSMLSMAVNSGINVRCLPTKEIWCEVDSEADLEVANNLFP